MLKKVGVAANVALAIGTAFVAGTVYGSVKIIGMIVDVSKSHVKTNTTYWPGSYKEWKAKKEEEES